MAGLSASGLKTQIRSYTETDSNVLSDSVLENIILNAQYRIFRDVPIDADRKQQTGSFVAVQDQVNAPAGSMSTPPARVPGGGKPTIIYKKVSGAGMQGQPLKTGSATDVPLIASANPSNFYTAYSQLIYNVVT